jgi:hypothetical protein
MYGLSETQRWSELAQSPMLSGEIRKLRGTILALAQHPVSHGSTDAYWIQFGERLRHWANGSVADIKEAAGSL